MISWAIGITIGVLLGFFLAALMTAAKMGDEQMYQDRCEHLEAQRREARKACMCGAYGSVEDAA